MPQVDINYLAVLTAAVAGMVVGALWYSPLMFGRLWTALSGMSQEQLNAAKAKGVGKSYALVFIGLLLMSYVLANAIVFASSYLQVNGVSAGLMAGFWNWLGFIAPVTLTSVVWENKSWKLWLLNNAHYLVALLVMGAILGGWR